MSTSYNTVHELPFYNLNRQESRDIGAWVHLPTSSELNSKDLFQDIIASPERNSDVHTIPYESYSNSKYYTVKQSGTLFQNAKNKNGFSMLHCDMRSFSKIYLCQRILLQL